MADRKGRREGDYVVGYGRPPKATQFKAGKSGNPKGRPKGSRSVAATLQHIVHRKVSVTENGKTRRLSVLEVILRRLVNDSMRGDPRAQKLIFSLVDLYSDSPAATRQLRDLLAEDKAILARYLPGSPDFVADLPASTDDEVGHDG